MEWIGIGVTLGVAIVGWIFAGLAHSKAKEANKIAKSAVEEAMKANEIAEDANKLSEDANTLVKRQVLQQADPSHVEWLSEWDEEGLILTVTNTGRDTAHNVSVLVKGKNVDRLSDGHGDIPRGQKLEIPFPEFREERREHNLAQQDAIARLSAGGIGTAFRPWKRTLTVDVRWIYQSGKPGSEILEQRIR